MICYNLSGFAPFDGENIRSYGNQSLAISQHCERITTDYV